MDNFQQKPSSGDSKELVRDHIIDQLIREDLRGLKPYSSARSLVAQASSERQEKSLTFLDANEYGDGSYASYPAPQPKDLKEKLSGIYGVKEDQILMTRGIDEGLDCFLRLIGTPGKDSVMVFEPTYDVYRLSATLQQLQVLNTPLDENFQISFQAFTRVFQKNCKCVFICNPNNPTGNLMTKETIQSIIEFCRGLCFVVIDEAYIEFAENQKSYSSLIESEPHVVVMRTLSKAYGLAGVRCGSVLAQAPVINALKKVLAPYPIPRPTVEVALKTLKNFDKKSFLQSKEKIRQALTSSPVIKRVFPTDANFFLAECEEPTALYKSLLEEGILIRDRQKKVEHTLRVSIGTPEQCEAFTSALAKIQGEVPGKMSTGSMAEPSKVSTSEVPS